MSRSPISLLVIFALILVSFVSADEQENSYLAPVTEHHEALAQGVGNWNVSQKIWMTPGAEPVTANGTCVCKSILDGRGTTVSVETNGFGGQFKGFGVFTWNVTKKKYESVWLDFYSYNGLDEMEGSYNKETNSFTWTGKFMDVMNGGQVIDMTMVEKFIDEDTLVSEFYVDVNGQKIKTMENTYTRVKENKEEAKATTEAVSIEAATEAVSIEPVPPVATEVKNK